jgi:hypothetical protein
MDNAHEPIEAFAAAMKAGFTHVPLNSRLTAAETADLFRDSGAVALIADQAHLPVVEKARADMPGPRHLITTGRSGHAKGVTTTQQEIPNQAYTAILPEYGLTAASRLLALYPHSSAASTNCAFGPTWILGATLIVDDMAHSPPSGSWPTSSDIRSPTPPPSRPCWSVSCATSRRPGSSTTSRAWRGSLTGQRPSHRRSPRAW